MAIPFQTAVLPEKPLATSGVSTLLGVSGSGDLVRLATNVTTPEEFGWVDGGANCTSYFNLCKATGKKILLAKGTYPLDPQVFNAKVEIEIARPATAKLRIGGTLFRFNSGAAGSAIYGYGTVDGNRGALIDAYLALPRAEQPGLYVMSQEWNAIEIHACDDFVIDGLTIRNAMTFAIGHEAGQRVRGTNLLIRDCTVGVVSYQCDWAVWENITELNIGNQVNDKAIPWFAYANTWADCRNAKISNISLDGYTPYIYDEDGLRIGDPLGGAFMTLRCDQSVISGMYAKNYIFDDDRGTPCAWGLVLDNPYRLVVSDINIRGWYYGIQIDGAQGMSLTNFFLDGENNNLTVVGKQASCGLWMNPTGQLPANLGSSFYDHISMMPQRDIQISNGACIRFDNGALIFTGNAAYSNVKFNGNVHSGALLWSSFTAPDYPASEPFPVNDIMFSNCEFNYNGGAGVHMNTAEDVKFVNCRANNNGQELASAVPVGFEFRAGFGGIKKNIFLSMWEACDTQTFTVADNISFIPGSTDANDEIIVVSAQSTKIHPGQHILVKGALSGPLDVDGRVMDIKNDFITLKTDGPRTFVETGNLTSLTGTISIPNGSNILTGSGTAFTTEVKGPCYIKTSTGQYLKIGQVKSDTQLQMDTIASPAVPAGTTAQMILCDLEGIPSQHYGVRAQSDANITNITIGDPSSFRCENNTVQNLDIAASSMRNEYITDGAFTPTANGGTGVSFTTKGLTYRRDGKMLHMRGFVQLAYTTIPNYIVIPLPNSWSCLGGGSLAGFNSNTNDQLYGISNGANAFALFPAVGEVLASATGQFLHFSGMVEIQ